MFDEPKLPTLCPSCNHPLHITELCCDRCDTKVSGHFPLPALLCLDPAQQQFALDFIKVGGSLKDLARQRGLSYPTVRNQLDALIASLDNPE